MTKNLQRKSITVPCEIIDVFRDLEPSQVKDLLIAMADYKLDGTEPNFADALAVIWKLLKLYLNRHKPGGVRNPENQMHEPVDKTDGQHNESAPAVDNANVYTRIMGNNSRCHANKSTESPQSTHYVPIRINRSS